MRLSKASSSSTRRRSPRRRSARCTAPCCAAAARSRSRCSGPDIRERVLKDLDALDEIAALLERFSSATRNVDASGVLEEFRRTLLPELDYREEARNLVALCQPAAGLRAHRRAAAGRRLHDRARADDGLRRGHEDHGGQPGRADRGRRRRARRRAVPRLPAADPGRRRLPRRPASRQRPADARPPAGADRPRDGRPPARQRCRSSCSGCCWRSATGAATRRRRSSIALGERREDFDEAADAARGRRPGRPVSAAPR